jgi:hypothetical protein
MTKFNKFDQYVIEQALEMWVENFEKEIKAGEATGHRLLFASGYPAMVSKDIQFKVNSLTKKK